MDPRRLFKDNPPKEPLTSIAAMVRDWKFRFGPKGPGYKYVDHIPEYCAEANTLVQAINRACDSKNKEGKQHNHQSRVTRFARDHFAIELSARSSILSRCEDFDQLFDTMEELIVHGIGPVTLYDVAVRINGYLKLPQTSLYLHAGVRIGWKLLYGKRSPAVQRVKMPKELKALSPDDAESFLCAYRHILNPGLLK